MKEDEHAKRQNIRLARYMGWRRVRKEKGSVYGVPPRTDGRFVGSRFPVPQFENPDHGRWLLLLEEQLDQDGLLPLYARKLLGIVQNGRDPLTEVATAPASAKRQAADYVLRRRKK